MPNLLGLHDRQAASFSPIDTWILDTIALSESPISQAYNAGFHWITRVNWGYGSTGTIPLDPSQQVLFLERFTRYVKQSTNCTRWIIGNESNLSREWPDNKPIYPNLYAEFYMRCRDAIHNVMGVAKHEVLIAAPGPWNNELKYSGNIAGDWVKYFQDVLNFCGEHWDGSSIHSYTHGYDPALVTSQATMNPPFQNRHYNFRAYLDFINAIPDVYGHKPIYLTEANGNGPWQRVRLMPEMAKEIDRHNKSVKIRKIKSLIFYRYPDYDEYGMVSKPDILAEYKEAVALGFLSPLTEKAPTMPIETKTPPLKPILQVGKPQATIKASVLNVRDKPGVKDSQIKFQATEGQKVSILEERNVDGQNWVRIGDNLWVTAEWTIKEPIENAPIPDNPQSNWARSRAFTARWEGGFQDLDWDIGNWTGGAVGVGIKKGTKFGISANSYPNLDIKNISREQADKIYFEDFWLRAGCNKLLWPYCLFAFDTAINFGATTADIWLDQAAGNPFVFLALRLKGYRRSAAWKQAGNAWIDRTAEMMLEAGE